MGNTPYRLTFVLGLFAFLSVSSPVPAYEGEWVFKGADARGKLENLCFACAKNKVRAEERNIGIFWMIGDESADLKEKFGKGALGQVETSAGLLTAYSYDGVDDRIYLGAKELKKAVTARLVQVYPEKSKLPSIVLVHMFLDREAGYDPSNIRERPYLVDVSVSPPFISKDYMPIITGVEAFSGKLYPVEQKIKIKKADDNSYIISGLSWREQGKDGKPLPVSYIYNRKDGTLTLVK